MNEAEKRVRELAEATEWSGDMRVNMTRVIGALRCAVKLLDERDVALLEARSRVDILLDAVRAQVAEHRRQGAGFDDIDQYGDAEYHYEQANKLEASLHIV